MSSALFGRIVRRGLICISATLFLPVVVPTLAEAKTPGHTYCFKGSCHRVNTISETAELVGQDQTLSTSFYDDCSRDPYNPCGLTSSGEVFHADTPDNAASPIYPDGTVLLVRNAANGRSAVVRVNNAGPYYGNRKLDVSRATAEELGFKKRGVAKLQVRVVAAPTLAESKYKKNRHYAQLPGFIGKYASLDDAHTGTQLAMGLIDKPAVRLAASAVRKPSSTSRITPLFRGSQIASAEAIIAAPVALEDGSPADQLRAEARRSLGLEPLSRLPARATMTADALFGQITQSF